MTPCEGTACNNTATRSLLITANLAVAFGDRHAPTDELVARSYCDDCAARAHEREFSRVCNDLPLSAASQSGERS